MPAARVSDPQFQKMLTGYGVTFAEVLYRMPDHPALLQTFSWQFDDIAPNYPRLKSFLDHWRREVDARIHSIRITHQGLIKPQEIRLLRDVGYLN